MRWVGRDFLRTDFRVGNAHLVLRPVQEDRDFLSQVYASTRAEEMALVDWSDDQKTAFLQMQFDAQTKHYRTHYRTAQYYVVEVDGVSSGRLIRERTPSQLLMMDIALLPAYRNRGVGSAIIRELMDEAARDSLPLVLHVEFFNPVMRLYTRLGFVKTREINAVYHEMAWTPERVGAPPETSPS